VLHPSEVCIAIRRDAELPADILPEPLAAPVFHVKRRVGEDEVRFQVGMQIAVETVAVFRTEISLNPPDGEVHLRKFPGGRVRLLPVDADIPDLPSLCLDKLLALDKHAS